jgi:hypothetical protein
MKDYLPKISLVSNRKGVLDLDTVKGCEMGLKAHQNGCYGLCYACKTAKLHGLNFSKSVTRLASKRELWQIRGKILKAKEPFVRIGTMGDPCHDWAWTLTVCKEIYGAKPIIIVTKHWIPMTDTQMAGLGDIDVILNTSISPLDTAYERQARLTEYERYKEYGKSVLRIVSCDFNLENPTGRELSAIQDELFTNTRIIDNPLRLTKTYPLYKDGIIKAELCNNMDKVSLISLHNKSTYLGCCQDCPELCGINL